MKLYICGPMRGIPLFNFPAFHAAADRLRALGHEVVNPAARDESKGFDPAKDEAQPIEVYMREDLSLVCGCDGVACLPGWRESTGARREVQVAQWCGRLVLDAETLQPITETVLEEAGRLTSADRNRHYGHPRDNFQNTAAMWTAYLRGARKLAPGCEVSPRDFGMMMVLCKCARDANMPQRDNLTDAAGYVRCIERLDEPV